MVTRRRVLGFWALVLVAVGSVTPAVSGQTAPASRIAVVVAKNSSLSDMSFSDLRRLYKGEFVNDQDGNKLIPLAFPPRSPERTTFDQVVLAMSPAEVANYWVDRKIRGMPGAPKVVDSADLIQRLVNRLPASIGYVPAGQVTNEVKVLRIDGKGQPTLAIECNRAWPIHGARNPCNGCRVVEPLHRGTILRQPATAMAVQTPST